jgi:hypothetical protein
VTQPNLKVMVDEDLLDRKTIEALRKLGTSIDVKTILECDFKQGADDKDLVAATKTKRRVLLTANYRDINERVYPPCFHGGLILIKHPRPSPTIVVSRMRAFCRSGKRSQAKGHVTHLNEDRFTIHKLHKEKIEGDY